MKKKKKKHHHSRALTGCVAVFLLFLHLKGIMFHLPAVSKQKERERELFVMCALNPARPSN